MLCKLEEESKADPHIRHMYALGPVNVILVMKNSGTKYGKENEKTSVIAMPSADRHFIALYLKTESRGFNTRRDTGSSSMSKNLGASRPEKGKKRILSILRLGRC